MPLSSFDVKNCLVVDAILFSNLNEDEFNPPARIGTVNVELRNGQAWHISSLVKKSTAAI
jgi:hypothetical protein